MHAHILVGCAVFVFLLSTVLTLVMAGVSDHPWRWRSISLLIAFGAVWQSSVLWRSLEGGAAASPDPGMSLFMLIVSLVVAIGLLPFLIKGHLAASPRSVSPDNTR